MSASESLKFGDTVLLQVQTKEQSGYVYSELSGSRYNFLTLLPGFEKQPNFANIKYAAYKVLVPNKYKAKQRLNELQQREVDEYLLARAMEVVKAEGSENEQEQSRRRGSNVSFGDCIQLQHAASKKYATVRSEAAKAEGNNLLVNLSAENSEAAIFKVLPKYKVRSEGDDVRFGDQMKLESIKTQGQYLHVSGPHRTLGAAGFTVLPKCFEVNLSSTDTAFSLVHHQSPLEDNSGKVIQAGSCIRLFHKEDECYIVAEGSFAESNPVIEDVHCRQRKVDSRKHAQPSTSSNTFWQIEKEGDPRSGDTLFWEESCRIKHLPTRRYLCVTKDLKVTLKQRAFDKSDFDTIFSFYPLIREGDEVLFESYASIKHILTGEWLHLDRQHYVRKNFNPDAKGLAGLQWDSAELFKLSTRPTRGDYDSFAIQQVQEDLLDKFNHVAGIVPVFTAHITHIQGDKMVGLTEQQSLRVKETLTEFRRWLVNPDSRDTKDHQKLLRNLRVLEQLAEILTSGDHEDIKKSQVAICKECYNVFKRYLEGDSRKNENYLARFIEFFQTQMSKGLNAEEVLVEIVQDNLSIISKMAETRMEQMIEQFCTTQDSRFLYFLSSLCVCNDRPIPSTQNRLLKDLVLKRGKEFFLRIEVVTNDDGEKTLMYCRQGSPSNKRTIRSLKSFGNTKKRMSIVGRPVNKDYDLLEAQLHLFGKLCKGNNELALKSLVHSSENPEGYITFEQAHMCAKDENVDVTLRSKYVELILVMFVDVGDNRPFIDHLCYSFIYDDLVPSPYADTGDDDITALTEVKNEHFPELKKWILNTVQNQTALDCDSTSTDKNGILEQIVDILGHLVRFGYYDNENDVNEMMKPLIQLLDNKNDVPNPTGKDETSVYSVKMKALEVMELFFKFKFYVKLQKFMYDFQVLNDDKPHNMPQILEELMQSQHGSEQMLHEKETRMAVINRLKFLCDDSDRGGGFAPKGIHGLEEVLLSLAQKDCDNLVTASLSLLTEMHFFEDELFSRAQQAQLLTSPTSIKHYKKVNHQVLPKLMQLLRVDTDQKNQDVMIQLMQSLSDLCILPISTGVLELNTENQIMLDNFGLVSEILSYVLTKGSEDQRMLPSSSDDAMETSVREDLFSVCLCLLRYLATGRISVQKRLFNRIDDLLELKIPERALADVADLLTEVFTGGPELIFKVSKEHIERIFEIIVDCENSNVQAQFMVTLQAMAKIEELDIPYGHNQALIIKNFCRLRESFCSEFLGEGQEMVEKRLEILQEPVEQELEPQQQLLTGVADLLATCAETKDQFIESVCQNIFSIEELVEIMCSSDLSPALKRPFVRFLILVYMKVDEDKPEARLGSSTLTHGSDIWKYLSHLAGLLQDIATALCSVPSDEKGYVRSQLSSSNRRRNSFSSQSPQYPGSRLPHSVSAGIRHVTDDKGQMVPGLLEYLAEGIIPFLQAFYTYFFDPEDAASEDDRDSEYFISTQIAKNLTELSDQLVKFFSNETSLALYQSTMNKLLSYEEIKLRAGIDPKKTHVIQRSQDSASPPASSTQQRRFTLQRLGTIDRSAISEEPVSEDTLKEYEDQKELNDLFHLYAKNCHTVYCGPNLASEQIFSSVEGIEYSEDGEELPLGPNFQHLVELFFNSSANASAFSLSGVHVPTNAFSLSGVHASDFVIVKKEAERLLTQLEISFSRTEQLSEKDQVQQDILDIRCLQILRALIHNQTKLIDPELKDRDPIKFRKRSTMFVVPVQNCIQRFENAIKRVMPFLSHPNENIAREALALMKALLFSGNETVQDGVVQGVKETREEKLFISLKAKLELASIQFKETKDLETQLASRKRSKHRLASKIASVEDPEVSLSIVQPAVPEKSQSNKKEVAIEMEVVHKPDKSRKSIDDSRPLLLNQESLDTARRVSLGHDRCTSPNGSSENVDLLSQVLASDTSWTSLVLEVIGLMCDGQHRVLQDYLREQPDNFRSLNVISEICELLQTYTNDLTRNENLEEIHHILQSLIETCVGNFQNQKVIFYKQVLEPIDKILQIPVDDLHNECTLQDKEKCPDCKLITDLIQVKGSAVELLTIMLEETSPETSSIAKGIGSSIDEDSLLKVIQEFYEWKSQSLVKEQQMDDDCQRGMFRTYHVITSLMQYKASSFGNRDELKQRYKDRNERKELPSECNDYTRSIEIHYEEEGCKPILTRISFPFDPNNALRDEITEQVRWNVNRDSMEDKQTSLLSLMPALKRDITHQMRIKGPRVLKPLLSFHTLRVKILMLLTILLNMLVLFVFEVPERLNVINGETNEPETNRNESNKAFRPDVPQWFEPYLLYILGIVHFILSIMVVVEYFIVNWPHFQLPQFLYKIWADITRLFSRDRNKPLIRLPQFTLLDVNILGVSTMYMIIFLLSSLLSLAFSGYFYSICLLFIIVNNDILIRVLKAVTKNGISLIWVAILGTIVLFIYAVISFAFFHNQFFNTDDAQLHCATLAQCMYSILRYGLIDNIGLLVPLQSVEYDAKVQPVRLIYDISFFIIVTTIGLNIVFGIIVDTFGELREERSNVEVEQRSKCFICDLPSYEFERRGEGFKNHIRLSHNMWDYVYYSHYLDSIDTGDHTAIQKYVYEHIEEHETGFFPQEEANSLPSDDDTTGQSLNELQNKVEFMLNRFKEKEHAKSIFKKREHQKLLEMEISKHIHDKSRS